MVAKKSKRTTVPSASSADAAASGQKRFPCPDCPYSTDHSHHIRTHRDCVHSKTLNHACKECGARFVYRDKLVRHVIRCHKEDDDVDDGKFPCKLCSSTFAYRETLAQHVSKIHKESSFAAAAQRFSCVMCPFSTLTLGSLKKHSESVHQGLRPYNCGRCGKSFTTKSIMERHMASDGRTCYYGKRKKQFACESCHYSSDKALTLKRHTELIHLKLKQFRCHRCGKEFGLKHNMLKHMEKCGGGALQVDSQKVEAAAIISIIGRRKRRRRRRRKIVLDGSGDIIDILSAKEEDKKEVENMEGDMKEKKDTEENREGEDMELEDLGAKVVAAGEKEEKKEEASAAEVMDPMEETFGAVSDNSFVMEMNDLLQQQELPSNQSISNLMKLTELFMSTVQQHPPPSLMPIPAPTPIPLPMHTPMPTPTPTPTSAVPGASAGPTTVEEENDYFTCLICQRDFTAFSELTNHSLLIHGLNLNNSICGVCGDRFEKEEELVEHVILAHQVQVCYRCNVCKVEFGNNLSFLRHYKDNHM